MPLPSSLFYITVIINCILKTNLSVSLLEPEGLAWECIEAEPLVKPVERDEEEEEWKEGEREHCSTPSKSVREKEVPAAENFETLLLPQSGERETAQQSWQSPSSETPVCAKNISLTPSGEKVVLWTRSAPTQPILYSFNNLFIL